MFFFRVLIVTPLVIALIGAAPLPAEAAYPVSGRALDAAGNVLAGVRVELVSASPGQPTALPRQVAFADAQGAWSFADVPAGDYVVQILHEGRTIGVPVSVTTAGVETIVIVAPSAPLPAAAAGAAATGTPAAAAPAVAAAGGSLLPGVMAAGLAAVAATAAVVVRSEASPSG